MFDIKTDFSSIFKDSTQSFKEVDICYQTVDDLDEWLNSFSIDEGAFISKIKKQIANTNLTFEQEKLAKYCLFNDYLSTIFAFLK